MSLSRRTACILLSIVLGCMIGCSTDYRSEKGMFGGYEKLALPPGPGDAGPLDANGRVPAERMNFTLTEPRTIAGEQLRAKFPVSGLRIRGQEVLPLVFYELRTWRSDFALARRWQESTFSRYDLATGKTEATPYVKITEQFTPNTRRVFRYGWLGNESGDTVHLLGPDGRNAGAIGGVSFIMALGDGGHLVNRFETTQIYDSQGRPLSPSMKVGDVLRWQRVDGSQPFYSVRCDPKRHDLGWPLRPDGTILPMPPGLLGVRGLAVIDWIAWGAVWATPDGERIAWLDDPYDLEAIIASRARAEFAGIEIMSRTIGSQLDYRVTVLVSMPGVDGWRAFDLPKWTEADERIFPSAAAAKAVFDAKSEAAGAAHIESIRSQRALYLARMEEERKRNAQRADAASQAQFARELRERQQATANADGAADAVYWRNQFQYLTGQKW